MKSSHLGRLSVDVDTTQSPHVLCRPSGVSQVVASKKNKPSLPSRVCCKWHPRRMARHPDNSAIPGYGRVFGQGFSRRTHGLWGRRVLNWRPRAGKQVISIIKTVQLSNYDKTIDVSKIKFK